MTYGTYGSRQDLWEHSNYTNVKSDFMWMLTLCSKKNAWHAVRRCEFRAPSTFGMWSDCRPVACAKSCVDTVGNPAEKSTGRCTYHLWPHQKIFISHAAVACISHIQLKTCIRFQSKSSTYHIKVSMFKSSSNTLMIFDVKLQLDAQCRRSEIEFDAVFLYQYLRSWFRMHY